MLTLNTHRVFFRLNLLTLRIVSPLVVWQRAIDMHHSQRTTEDEMHQRQYLRDRSRRRGTLSQPGGSLPTITRCRSSRQHRKYLFFQGQIEYCGHKVIKDRPSHRGRSTARERLTTFHFPQVVQQLPAGFPPDLATTLHPLKKLLHKGIKFVWSYDCQAAFPEGK